MAQGNGGECNEEGDGRVNGGAMSEPHSVNASTADGALDDENNEGEDQIIIEDVSD